MNKEQAEDMLEVFEKHRSVGSIRKLMVGVMMSYKTHLGLPSRWEKAFPKPSEVKDIFFPHPSLLNTVHYADYEGVDVQDSLDRITEYGGSHMDALQLDMAWPHPKIIKGYHQRHPSVQLVIQADTTALSQAHDNPDALIEKLKEYENSLSYVLLDKSVGKGKPMNEKALRPFAEALAKNLPHVGITGGRISRTPDYALGRRIGQRFSQHQH